MWLLNYLPFKIIFQEKIAVRDDENVGELYSELMVLGATVLRKTVDAIEKNNYPQIPQDHITDIKHAPKIFKETCKIDWSKDVDYTYNFIRGLSPYPAAFTMLDGKVFKIYRADKITAGSRGGDPAETDATGATVQNRGTGIGKIETDNKTFLRFFCTNGLIDVKECQLEGKKKMNIEEFLRGAKLS